MACDKTHPYRIIIIIIIIIMAAVTTMTIISDALGKTIEHIIAGCSLLSESTYLLTG